MDQPICLLNQKKHQIQNCLTEPCWYYAQLSVSVIKISLDILEEIKARIFPPTIDALGPQLLATQLPYHFFVVLKP